MQNISLIRIEHVEKTYPTPSGPFTALTDISLEIARGDYVAIVGRSGSGKSTLLNLLAGIDRPTGGVISVAGQDLDRLGERGLARWRGTHVGVVFQFFQLLPTMTIAENVMLPMDFCSTWPSRERRPRALALLDRVGIADQADKLPASLSGGQQQRAAIARALANDPSLIVADEPTGNLDTHTSDMILDLFARLSGEGKTILMVSHERDVAQRVSRALHICDGRLAEGTEAAHA